MQAFGKPYQLWLQSGDGYSYSEYDDLLAALSANRLPEGDWYITFRLDEETARTIINAELSGHPSTPPDPLGKLDGPYQLWNSMFRDGGYSLSVHKRLMDALAADRCEDDWYVTTVVPKEGLAGK